MKRFIEGTDRGQSTLFPECLEDWIDENNPVRVIDVFVDELDPKRTLATTGGLAEPSTRTMLRREARLLRARTVEGVAIAAGSTKRMTPRRIPRAAYTGRFDQTVRAGRKMRMTERRTSGRHRVSRSNRQGNCE
jgi:hypothetical protein